MYWRPLSVYLFFSLFSFRILIVGAVFGGDSEAITVNNSVIVLNLEDIKYDYAGKYEDPWISILQIKKASDSLMLSKR
jgi:protease-4